MNRNGLKIGEFSRLCRVTVRALRHYEKIKLLVPEIIDYSTGYRYYSVVQMQKALNIVRLKKRSAHARNSCNSWSSAGTVCRR